MGFREGREFDEMRASWASLEMSLGFEAEVAVFG